jgi:hypothetical protein
LLLGVNFALLGISIYLGLMSGNQMKEIVKEDFNQQQLVLAKYTASLLEQETNFLTREMNALNFSPSIQYLEPLSWANRMRATLASVREEDVVEILRISTDGNRAFQLDSRGRLSSILPGAFQDSHSWAFGPPANYEKTLWSGRLRPPGGPHRLESLRRRKNFLKGRRVYDSHRA